MKRRSIEGRGSDRGVRGGARSVFAGALTLLALAGCQPTGDAADSTADAAPWAGVVPAGDWTRAVAAEVPANEPRFRALTQLTHGGTNAEAYFSAEGDRLIFQSTWTGVSDCDQMYTMNLDGTGLQQVSTGEGRTTCGYFYPGGDRILFASTHPAGAMCPPAPDRSRGYVWGLFEYDLFIRDLTTGEVLPLDTTPGYDAEATISPDGETIIFTSTRSGDLDLWAMDADGSNPRPLTNELGYEGGAFFSPDGSKIVYRAHIPLDDAERADYQALLAENLVRGGRLELFVMDADGSNKVQITNAGAATFAPYWHPGGEKIVFSSNMDDPMGRFFALYIVNADGTGLERITQVEGFHSFPMFSPDGRLLAFSSDRGAPSPSEINVFLADWVDELPAQAAP